MASAGFSVGKSRKKITNHSEKYKNRPFIQQYLKDNWCPSGVNNLRQLEKNNPKI